MAFHTTQQMRRLARARLDHAGNWCREMLPRLQITPRGGWIAATRDALGMSQSELARRLGVRPSSVVKLEKSERAGTVRIETLRRAAAAMDCELVVLVVPQQPLQSSVDQQRLKLFNATLNRVAAHMKLEGQSVSDDLYRHLLQQAEAEIPDTALWRGELD
ncbi:helix-turn-helix domain-containing protein [Dyella japonica]|uniref:helix-turn-helix domain-containing protein n=1 Tax=Dyella japonica TaxID=231455 RepID=UPI0009DB3158|nr:helix-turn-helix domain-containing protein [Dyella japonica]